MPGCRGAYVNVPPNADGTATLGSRPSREYKVTRTGQGLATLGLLLGCAYGSVASAAQIMVCVYEGVPGPSDTIECEAVGGEKTDHNLASLYEDGWKLAELEVTSKFGGATTVMFVDKD